MCSATAEPIPTSKRGNIPPAGGAKGAAAGAGTRPPASPARQQQQRGGRPSTPPSASAAGGGGGSSAAAKPSEDKQQQKAAAAAGGEDKPAGSGSGQLPKAVRKAPPGAAAAAGAVVLFQQSYQQVLAMPVHPCQPVFLYFFFCCKCLACVSSRAVLAQLLFMPCFDLLWYCCRRAEGSSTGRRQRSRFSSKPASSNHVCLFSSRWCTSVPYDHPL